MAISVLDVRDTVATPDIRVPALRLVAGDAAVIPAPRRLPLPALAGGLVAIVESVGLLAVALTGLDGALSSSVRPAGWMIALGLLALAGWILLCAGGGAALIDGAGRRLVMGVAYAELGLVAALLVVATALPVFVPPAGMPLPLLGLVMVALPIGKLLMAGAPATERWVTAGPRVRVCRPDPVAVHRMLATVTLGVIGAALVAIAVLAPAQGPGDGAESAAATVVHSND
jgi:hypothetical protein